MHTIEVLDETTSLKPHKKFLALVFQFLGKIIENLIVWIFGTISKKTRFLANHYIYTIPIKGLVKPNQTKN